MTNEQTIDMVQSKIHSMFESLHIVMDEMIKRPDLINPLEVSIAIKQMEIAETVFIKALKVGEK